MKTRSLSSRRRILSFALVGSLPPWGLAKTALAQTPTAPALHSRTSTRESTDEVAPFPLTRVDLYKNGVGFFEHAGRVTGNAGVTIDFTTAQLNDVLQSLTAIDLNGGRIAGVGYNSTTPLAQQLKSLALGLGEETSTLQFFQALRGARVEVHGPGAGITGRLLNIEQVNTPGKDGQPAGERRLITIVSDAGDVRTVELTTTTEVRLLDTGLHTDITRYLQLLATNRGTAGADGLRHLTLQDNGTGARELHVSYISEVPIWKSTYRILFTEPSKGAASATAAKPTATVQGWSVVDNTTGVDWDHVQLSLIAGSPQSFIQPLSIPYYSRRPQIGLPQSAQLSPQTHDSGDNGPPAKAAPGGVLGAVMGGVAGQASSGGLRQGIYGGSGRANLNENYIEGIPAAPPMAPSMGGAPRDPTAFQYLNGGMVEGAAASSFNSNASTTSSFDDYFAYHLTEPVTIRKNESAMVPILQTKVDAERVTLWTRQQPVPLRALWITNTSALTLDRGSFSILEDGSFAGEGLLDPIHPAERRLLSYAVDQAVRVTTESEHTSQRVTQVTAAKGVLTLQQTQIAELTYVIHNAAADARTVVLEHPVRPGYTLDSDPKPAETTPTAYRFEVVTKPAETVRLHVGERSVTHARYQLTNSNDSQLAYILTQTDGDAGTKAALQPILDARRRVADAQSAVDAMTLVLSNLRSDEERERANLTAVAAADKASRERFLRELNNTEDAIGAAQKQQTAAQSDLQAARASLANSIEAIQIDQPIQAR